jgi:hypothetical protein
MIKTLTARNASSMVAPSCSAGFSFRVRVIGVFEDMRDFRVRVMRDFRARVMRVLGVMRNYSKGIME